MASHEKIWPDLCELDLSQSTLTMDIFGPSPESISHARKAVDKYLRDNPEITEQDLWTYYDSRKSSLEAKSQARADRGETSV